MNSLKKVILCLSLFSFTLVNGESLYTARDLGTLSTDRSEAKSLNENGEVVGKYFHNNQASDFLWTPESGLQVLTNEADQEIFPTINNLGHVMGCVVQPGSWFSSAQIQSYTFNQKNGLKFHSWVPRDNGIFIFLNNNFAVTCNHIDIFKSTYSALAAKDQVQNLTEPAGPIKIYPTAMNNTSQILFTMEVPGVFGYSFLATYSLYIYDIATGESTVLAEDKLYYGLGINDNNMVIARDKTGYEGFYGSKELGMHSLGNFIPNALNNRGEFVGKKGKEVLLRKPEGTMIDLNQATDFSTLRIDRVTDVFAINDKGQILVTAQISGKPHAILLEPR